jgi:hypothetical protein
MQRHGMAYRDRHVRPLAPRHPAADRCPGPRRRRRRIESGTRASPVSEGAFRRWRLPGVRTRRRASQGDTNPVDPDRESLGCGELTRSVSDIIGRGTIFRRVPAVPPVGEGLRKSQARRARSRVLRRFRSFHEGHANQNEPFGQTPRPTPRRDNHDGKITVRKFAVPAVRA